MPTLRPRHMITETDEVQRALDLAATAWPDLDRAKLLKRLLELGSASIAEQLKSSRSRRLSSLEAAKGALEEVWPDDWREESRLQWPT